MQSLMLLQQLPSLFSLLLIQQDDLFTAASAVTDDSAFPHFSQQLAVKLRVFVTTKILLRSLSMLL